MKKIVIGVSGASGMPLAHTVLHTLAAVPDIEIHLVISAHAERVLQAECGQGSAALARYAHHVYAIHDIAACLASGSWQHAGMIVCPCSMSTLASIASGVGLNLLHRAADVTLKERRPLILVARETPLSRIHLHNMQIAAEAGAIIMPFSPAFYTKETSLHELMRHFTGRILDQMGIEHQLCTRWQGAE